MSVRDESPRHDVDGEATSSRDRVAERLRHLTPEARAALRRRVAAPGPVVPARAPAATGPAPLSFAQQRLGFIEQLEAGSVHHNDGMLLFLDGRLDHRVLAESISEIVRRHGILRTAFRVVDGEMVQEAVPASPVDLPVRLLPEAAMDHTDRVLLEAFQREMEVPLALAEGVPLRVTLFRLSETEHVLGVTIHHLVCDLWSFSVFAAELSEIYQALLEGREHGLPDLPLQYADYARRQRAQLTDDRLAPHVAYWTQALGDAPAEHGLPIRRPRPATQSFVGAVERFTVDAATTERLKRWGQPKGFTLFMTLLAAFDIVLSKYGCGDDVVVVTPIATRGDPDLERLVGCFLNMLPLRLDLSGDPTFEELAGRARTACLDAYAHQDLPFDRLVQACQPSRSRSHQPIAQIAFALQNTPAGATELPGLSVRFHKADTGRARMDLSVWVTADERGLSGELEYDRELFDASVVRDLAAGFRTVLRGLAGATDQRLGEMSLLSPAETRTLVRSHNETRVDFQEPLLAPALFEQQAARTPGLVAVTSDREQLTYAELNGRANQLARLLRDLGVGPEIPVVVSMPRSTDEVVAILAVLKAGGVYVPVGGDPAVRRDAVLRLVAPPVVLTTAALADDMWAPGRRVVDVAGEWPDVDQYEDSNLPATAVPANLMYVLFTSGSTGEPKGVMVPHSGFCNRMLWGQRNYPLVPGDRVLRKAASTFDVSLDELFRALFNGATSVLMPESRVFDPAALAEAIRRFGVTDADFSPSALREFLATPGARDCTSLRRIVSGVETLPAAVVQSVFDVLDVDLFNLYGPTEVSVSCCAWPCTRGDVPAVVPVGWPMANVRVYILDRHLQPVPRGVVGDLYVAGAGLARGYLGRSHLTAERFLPDCFSEEPGARMYRSGDLARYRGDGAIEFVGRVDEQLNVRGYRVEPGEIEAALVEHPAVGGAAVVSLDSGGTARLVAYVTAADPGHPADSNTLRDWLRSRLPEYMVPAAFVTLDAMPMTRNGKLDRAALPRPEGDDAERAETRMRPSTEEERVLAAIWCDVLSLRDVGVHDDFFELGGDSLTAVRIVARAAQELGRDLEVAAIFDNPTVASLARRFEGAPVTARPLGRT